MDHVEELLRETLNDAARQAPAAQGMVGESAARSAHRRAIVVASVAAAAAVIAMAVPVALDHGLLTGDRAVGPPTGPSVTRHEPQGSPMPLYMGTYLSPDRRTLYAEVTESVTKRGSTCWTYVDGTARLNMAGVATVRLSQHTLFQTRPTLPPGQFYICDQPSVGGPWYSRINLEHPYGASYVIDGRTGKRHRILGTGQLRADQIVNWR